MDEANYISRPSLRQSGQQCRNCGLAWPPRNSPCPAQGQTCRKCNKLNHYARVCRSARVQVPNNRARVNVRQHNDKNNQENVHNIESQEPWASSPSSGSDEEFLFSGSLTHKHQLTLSVRRLLPISANQRPFR